MLRRAIRGAALAAAIAAGARAAPGPAIPGPGGVPADIRTAQALVDPTKTSIYLGSVSLTISPLERRDGAFSADYRARVVPFFFFGEHGHLAIEFSDDQLAQLLRGETVYFKGQAHNSSGEQRRIEGRAVPAGPGTARGKIKVRVFVGKIQLIFNSTFRLAAAR